jgi:D-hydroxyproline dehydrogenase subunit gamma
LSASPPAAATVTAMVTMVTMTVDGRAVHVPAHVSVAAALLDLGVDAFRRSARGDARGPLCGMGTCYECRVTIDGVSHRRACLVPVADGMEIVTADTRARA